MPQRTIAAGGGNWNSTSTWVEGAVPTSSDFVVGNASSGQLTINVAAACQYVDFTSYANTLTMNNVLTIGLASSTNTFGASMNFAGTQSITITVGCSIAQNTTNRIPTVTFTGTATRTFLTNMYVVNYIYAGAPLHNGNTIYVSGNFYTTSTVNVNSTSNGFGGTTTYVLDGNGIFGAMWVGTTITITSGAIYNTFGASCMMRNGATLIYEAGTPVTLFNIITNTQTSSNSTYNLNIKREGCNLLLAPLAVNSSFGNEVINLLSSSTFNIIGIYSLSRNYTTDSKIPQFTFLGNSVTANELNLFPSLRTTSVLTNPPTSSDFNYQSPTILFDRLYTHNITSLQLLGGAIPSKPVIKSNSAGNQVSINLGSKITSQIIDYNFTDVNASGGQQIVAINGTLSNTTNITNVYPSGSGGGETSSVFIS